MDSLSPSFKRCSKCGEVKPFESFNKAASSKDGLRSNCRDCQSVGRKAHYAKNSEQARATRLEYYYANAEIEQAKSRERSTAWHAANRDAANERRRNRRYENIASELESQKRYREANPEKVRNGTNRWFSKNPHKRRQYSLARKARKMSAQGFFTAQEFQAKLELYKGRCHWCHKPIKGIPHADHLIALVKGGSNAIENIVPSCAKCNLSKGPKLPWEFMGRLL